MRNIQIIDSAENCAYSVYQIDEHAFSLIFKNDGQNIEFIDDIIDRLGEKKAGEILSPVWRARIEKENAMGIHGTIFFGLNEKRRFYPNKRETDLDSINPQIFKK